MFFLAIFGTLGVVAVASFLYLAATFILDKKAHRTATVGVLLVSTAWVVSLIWSFEAPTAAAATGSQPVPEPSTIAKPSSNTPDRSVDTVSRRIETTPKSVEVTITKFRGPGSSATMICSGKTGNVKCVPK